MNDLLPMNDFLPMNIFGKVSLALIIALSGPGFARADDSTSASEPPPAKVAIQVVRGDRWVYETRDDITEELKSVVDIAATEVTGSEIDVRVRFTNATNGAETSLAQVFDANWRGKEFNNQMFTPNYEESGVPNDLSVGKTWSYGYESARISPPAHFKWVGTAKVEAWERVTVANGLSYDAFKIRYDTQVTPIVNNRKFEVHSQIWFAPAVNRYVKRVSESRQNGKISEASREILRSYTPHVK